MADALTRDRVIRSLREGTELRGRLEERADQIVAAARAMATSIQGGGMVLFFGNGGSAADAQHLAAELVGRFVEERPPFPAIALTTDSSAVTAIANDYGFEQVFARQVRAIGRPGGVAVAISTSGRSRNVVAGIEAARDCHMVTIGLLGGDGGLLSGIVDIPIIVPSSSTPRIQECHITIGHILCELIEAGLVRPG